MRSIKFNLSGSAVDSWESAVKLTENYLTGNIKANQLLNALPEGFSNRQRATCQNLFLGAIRHGHRIRHVMKPFIQRKPRALIEAIIFMAGYEILSEAPEKQPRIIHHAVENSKQWLKKPETALLNALLRKLPDALQTVHRDNRPDVYFSHPRWLFRRWNKAFGLQTAIELMKWNQQIPAIYLKLYNVPETAPRGLEPTQWPQFYKVSASASWQEDVRPLLNRGNAYVKDPSTRLAPHLLAPKKGARVLDLCAAPGGKTYELAHLMGLVGQIVALDLPGGRIEPLRENLKTLETSSLKCAILEANLLELDKETFAEKQLPFRYDAVMLDAPCSNTGVIQRRADVKWRLKPKDIDKCAELQKKLLMKASFHVKPGGRLVYSTCSIEPEENQAVVDAFLNSREGENFTLKESVISLPWETRHDGAGAFLLARNF